MNANMKEKLTILIAALFITLTAKGQNLFFIGENSFSCTKTITLQSNTNDVSDLNVLFAKDGKIGLFAIIAESSIGSKFSEKLIIYLENGTVISCTQRRSSDLVENMAKAVYSLTSDQLNKMKNSNIHSVRYTLELRTAEGHLVGEISRTASNKGAPTKTLVTDFFNE